MLRGSMAEEKMEFQAEVSKVLGLVINSLYSNKEIFLRELISNASDACDKLRYLSLTDQQLAKGLAEFSINIATVKKDRTITIADNGIGMNNADLVENLGTVARSGTTAFLESLSGDEKKDSALIGQFGVGFYASFSVAEKVEVLTRKAGEKEAWLWTSDGKSSYSIAEAERNDPGTSVTVYLKKEENSNIVNVGSISSFIAQPNFLPYNTSKGAVRQLTKCLALDLGKYSIRVNSISPGPIFTNEIKKQIKMSTISKEEVIKNMSDKTVLKRVGQPEDVANAIYFLASNKASFITGANLVIDGGSTIN